MHSAVLLRVSYRDLRVLFLAFRGFALARFNFAQFRRVVWYEASVSAAIENVFFTQPVLVCQSFADAFNADKKSSICASLNFFRFQWCIARIAFQSGNRPGILSVSVCINFNLRIPNVAHLPAFLGRRVHVHGLTMHGLSLYRSADFWR
jgi:hypothetical protein